VYLISVSSLLVIDFFLSESWCLGKSEKRIPVLVYCVPCKIASTQMISGRIWVCLPRETVAFVGLSRHFRKCIKFLSGSYIIVHAKTKKSFLHTKNSSRYSATGKRDKEVV
jgi:hypothetical protein